MLLAVDSLTFGSLFFFQPIASSAVFGKSFELRSMADQETNLIESPLHPRALSGPSREYARFVQVRQRILSIVRVDSPEKAKVLEEIVEALLEHDVGVPTGTISGLLASLGIGKKVYVRRKKRDLYKKVVNSILEQLFDPLLEFKMTKRDILDAFDANGMDREKVAPQQVSLIYVKVIHKLRVGELRDLTWEEELHPYISLKLREINLSRMDWELNGR